MRELDILRTFDSKKILVIGDAILDSYVYGRAVCKSLDTPTIESEEDREIVTFGGAGLVTSNILELGGSVIFFSVIGNDKNSDYYDGLNHEKLIKNFIIDKNRKTTIKKRFWIDGYKLLQINSVTNNDIDADLEKKIITFIESFIKEVDIVFMLDAQHGFLTEGLIGKIIDFGKKYGKPVYADSQISHKQSRHHFFKGIDCFFLNLNEALAIDPTFNQNERESFERIKKELNVHNLVVKLGAKGVSAFFNDKLINIPAYPVNVVDTCGAGDAFLAAFCLGERNFPEESIEIANKWAALSTTIMGTTPPRKIDLIKILK